VRSHRSLMAVMAAIVLVITGLVAIPSQASAAGVHTWYEIYAFNSGKCLDVTGGVRDAPNGTPIQQWTCTGRGNQLWRLAYTSSGATVFISYLNDKCLDVTNASTSDGARLQLWSCSGQSNQSWDYYTGSHGTTWKKIKSVKSGKCVDVTGGPNATGNGVPIQQWTCLGGVTNQEFNFHRLIN